MYMSYLYTEMFVRAHGQHWSGWYEADLPTEKSEAIAEARLSGAHGHP
jgi:hypothetical protein